MPTFVPLVGKSYILIVECNTSQGNCLAIVLHAILPHRLLGVLVHVVVPITYSVLISYCFALNPYEKHELIKPEWVIEDKNLFPFLLISAHSRIPCYWVSM